MLFRSGERKSSDGWQTFKFPQNFLRAYTPHDAKPFVSCLRGRFAIRLIKRNSHFARYEFSLIFSEFSRFVEALDSAEISAKVSNCICFFLSNFPIFAEFYAILFKFHFCRDFPISAEFYATFSKFSLLSKFFQIFFLVNLKK